MPNLPDSIYLFFFRCTRVQFEFILNEIKDVVKDVPLQSNLPLRKMLHIYLYCVGNNAYITEMNDRFAVSNSMYQTKCLASVFCNELYSKFVV